VYGQDAPEPTGREELEQLVTKGIKESDRAQMLTDLNKQLDKAIEREDMALAAEIQSKIAEISS
jgi:protein-arginine kinase activator protein McsA